MLKPFAGGTQVFAGRIARRVSRSIFSRFILDIDQNPRNVVFLAGSGRSGTTWVSFIINHRNEYRYIFEPFDPDEVDVLKGFAHYQYIRPGNTDRRLLRLAEMILSGRVRNKHIDSHNTRLFSRKRLVKDIRANHLLKWLHQNFPGIRIILLLRHPCAVASSRVHMGWKTYLDEFLAQPDLMEDFLGPFKEVVEGADSGFEKNVLHWCIENYVPLKQFRRSEIHLAFYECFCMQPKDEIARLCEFLGTPFDSDSLRHLQLPISVRKTSAILTGGNPINAWRQHVSDSQVWRAREILELFGLGNIYREDCMPDIDHAYTLLNGS